MAMVISRNRLTELFWKLHAKAFTATGGRLGRSMMGFPVLTLTTTGRKSGEPRTVALMYLPDDDRKVVIASNAGEPRHPAWWRNLEADPNATIACDGRTIPVRARAATGEERARLWGRFVAKYDGYETYRQRAANREIPVVVLEPRA